MRAAVLALGLSWALMGSAWAQQPGPATVVGSDALKVNGTVFRLNGLDAVEIHQFCFVDGQAWDCGAAATRALQTLADGVMVDCTPTSETSGNVKFAVCTVQGQDIGETMVRDGWAVASPSSPYVAAEQAARDASAGIWRGSFVAPSDFRQDIAAIEKSYLDQADATILADAEKNLDAATSISVFANAHIATLGPEEDGKTSDRQIRIHSLPPGFITDAVSPEEIFSWRAVARVLEKWRLAAVASVITGARSPIWEGVLSHAHRIETAQNATEYYRALSRFSTQWIAEGRQPILLTPPAMPQWIDHWFNSEPPEGAVVQKKADVAIPGYYGTIDGVDVYTGTPMPTDNAILLPQDLLVSASYRKNADGAILDLDQSSVATPELVFRYSIALEWKPDEIVWVHYAQEDRE